MEGYLDKKKIKLNEEKTKVIFFGKSRGRKAKDDMDNIWNWKGIRIELVKEIIYLGYQLSDDNKDTRHVNAQTAKARSALGRIWSIGENFYKNEWKERKILFESLVKSVLFYKVEIWRYEKYEVVERIKKKYMKWVLKLERNTPDYIVRRETKENSLWIEGIKRIKKYEEKLNTLEETDIRNEIWKRKSKDLGIKNRYDIARDRVMEISKEWHSKINMDEGWIADRIIEILQEKERIQDIDQIMKSRYLKEQKEYLISDWQKDEMPSYLKNKLEISIIARFGVGNEYKENKKWIKKEERICRLCKIRQETAERIY